MKSLRELLVILEKFLQDNADKKDVLKNINEEFLSLCKSNKVNRLSIGIETINDKFYKLLNRENKIEDIKNKIFLDIITIMLYYYYCHWRVGQVVKTPPSHGGFKGSNPLRVTN